MIDGIMFLWFAALLGGFLMAAVGFILELNAYEDWHYRVTRFLIVVGTVISFLAIAAFVVGLVIAGITSL